MQNEIENENVNDRNEISSHFTQFIALFIIIIQYYVINCTIGNLAGTMAYLTITISSTDCPY